MRLLSQIKNIRTIIFISLIVFLGSCSPQESHVKFKVYNLSTSDIFVQYFEQQTIDTFTLQIPTSQTAIVWDALHVGGGNETNWYYDYEIQINCITNALGDSTIFNPNIASNWIIANNEETEYRLNIGDNSF